MMTIKRMAVFALEELLLFPFLGLVALAAFFWGCLSVVWRDGVWRGEAHILKLIVSKYDIL